MLAMVEVADAAAGELPSSDRIAYVEEKARMGASHNAVKNLKAWCERMLATYPDAVRVTTASEHYGWEPVGGSKRCGGEPCEVYIISVAANAAGGNTGATSRGGVRAGPSTAPGGPDVEEDWLDENSFGDGGAPSEEDGNLSASQVSMNYPEVPSVFISGAHHGDETVGPTVSTELVEYLLRGYTAGDTWLTRLVKTRNIVVVPAANALGWDVHQREEADLDPNRDYPHDQPRECLQSQTAKTINSLFQEFRFRTCVTFHGGIDLIGYPWGDIEHDQRPTSPDDAVFTEAARIMRDVAGPAGEGRVYNYGTLATNPYSVAGGFEDWAYGASWSNQVAPTCDMSKSNGNTGGSKHVYNVAQATTYSDDSNRCMVYLIETSNDKIVNPDTLGHRTNMLQMGAPGDGHVPRNVRASLMMVDMARPYIQIVSIKRRKGPPGSIKDILTVSYAVGGCLEVDRTRVEVKYCSSGKVIASSDAQSGNCIWNSARPTGSVMDPFTNPEFTVELEVFSEVLDGYKFDVVVSANVDAKYARVEKEANPAGPPQLNIVRDNIVKGAGGGILGGGGGGNTRMRTYKTTAHVKNGDDLKKYEHYFKYVDLSQVEPPKPGAARPIGSGAGGPRRWGAAAVEKSPASIGFGRMFFLLIVLSCAAYATFTYLLKQPKKTSKRHFRR